MSSNVKVKQRYYRFAIVGVANTVIDFLLLFILHSLGLPTIISNIFSTSVAFVFSFFTNRSYTFNAADSTNVRSQLVKFTIVTLSSVWVLQGVIIAITEPWLLHYTTAQYAVLGAKLLATAGSLVYNYILYSAFVFPGGKRSPADKS